jgi:drug/metabolite transporter (DMT)-like permease
MIFGEIGNFTAYSFAPAVLVAPLGGVSVLVNAVIAWYFLNESFRKQDYIGYILAIVGGFIIVYFAPDVRLRSLRHAAPTWLASPAVPATRTN